MSIALDRVFSQP